MQLSDKLPAGPSARTAAVEYRKRRAEPVAVTPARVV
jgi:hypothetical protein